MPTRDRSAHLLCACLDCRLVSNTYTGEPKGWNVDRSGAAVVEAKHEDGDEVYTSDDASLVFGVFGVNSVGRAFRRLM